MIKFFIDVFCKDTIIGLSVLQDSSYLKIFKNKYSVLFSQNFIRFDKKFTDPIACHL